LTANAGPDFLYGGGGNDLLIGEEAQDYLYGGKGNDDLSGDDGNDHLFGEGGTDELFGGDGLNYFSGGAGADLCYEDKEVDGSFPWLTRARWPEEAPVRTRREGRRADRRLGVDAGLFSRFRFPR
jgi:hypothetical protein